MNLGNAIVCAGGHAKVVIATFRAMGLSLDVAFDDDASRIGSEILGVKIVGTTAQALESGRPLHLAIGANTLRRAFATIRPAGPWLTLIHPHSGVEPSASIGEGSLVALGALVQTTAKIGRHVIVNTGAIVEHDCDVGDYVHLASGVKLAGGVIVEAGAMIGVGAQVLPGVRIGAGSVVGGGAVVVSPVPPGVVVVGIPARILTGAVPHP